MDKTFVGLTIEEINELIKETEKKLKALKNAKFEMVNARNLFEEGREYRKRIYAASEELRRTNPVLFKQKCDEVSYVARNSWYLGLNSVVLGQRWESQKAKICSWASHGRVKSVTKLTDEEYRIAKIFALSIIREDENYWRK